MLPLPLLRSPVIVALVSTPASKLNSPISALAGRFPLHRYARAISLTPGA